MTGTVGIVTVGRSDFGIWRPVLRAFGAAPDLRPHLIVAGAHLDERFGRSIQQLEEEGFSVGDHVSATSVADTRAAVAATMGQALSGFAEVYARRDFALLLVLGDRFEMFAAAAAAVPFSIPIAHIHGGEVTEGAMDNVFRHAITKMSHLHFVSTEEHGRRVIRMGEEPWRVTVSGAPSLDNLRTVSLLDVDALERELGMSLRPAPLLATFHPVTLDAPEAAAGQIRCLLDALDAFPGPVVLTYPNVDTGHTAILDALRVFAHGRTNARLFTDLGTRRYFSLMRCAAAMVGNSSSGIVEAASFRLPVVNVGIRQQGRAHGRNVLDVPCEATAIRKAIAHIVAPTFKDSMADLRNPYGDGHAAGRIVKAIESAPEGKGLIIKKFHDAGEGANQ